MTEWSEFDETMKRYYFDQQLRKNCGFRDLCCET